MTIEQRVRMANGRPSGFDFMRLIFATSVIIQHTVNVTAGADAARALFFSQWRAALEPVLPMFFALSGFLVAASLYRCKSLIAFCGLRVLRIVPALVMEVAFSALVLGPLLTTAPLRQYFSSKQFAAYFLNIIGWIHYTLPWVFEGNPLPQIVNAQLWTVPWELRCYLTLALLAAIGVVWRRLAFLSALIVAQAALLGYVVLYRPRLGVLISGKVLVFTFLWGIAFYLYRDKIKVYSGLLWVAFIAMYILLVIPGGEYLVAIPAVYATVYLGILNPRKPRFLFDGDYSYGMYLYGFPVQQTAAQCIPGAAWYVNGLVSLCLVFLIAHFSWWFVEKPALKLKPALERIEAAMLARIPLYLRTALLSKRLPDFAGASARMVGASLSSSS